MHSWVILRVFQRIYLIGFANNVSKERQYKGYCLIYPMRAILGNARRISGISIADIKVFKY